LAKAPVSGPTARYYQKLAWASATFALFTDLALLTLGVNLKRREKLTGRFADVLSWLYMGTATLRRFEAEGCQPEDLPLVHWSLQYALAQIQEAFEGIISNSSFAVVGTMFQGILQAWWRFNSLGTLPSDKLGSQVARILQTPGSGRDRLTHNIYLPNSPQESLGRMEQALLLAIEVEPILKKIKAASHAGLLPDIKAKWLVETALEKGIITRQEMERLGEAQLTRLDAVQVDSFALEEYLQRTVPNSTGDKVLA
jgi:acyl-CoA dehydrogenase